MKIKNWFTQLFCKHDYSPVPDEELAAFIKESNELLRVKQISSFSYQEKCLCRKCNKEAWFGTTEIYL
jgi:hypothetical protein